MPAEGGYVIASRILTAWYFIHFLVILPVLGLFETSRGRRHAETLVPAIEFVCKQADVEISEFGATAWIEAGALSLGDCSTWSIMAAQK